MLVETGRLTSESLSVMLIRKLDWHDYDGTKHLLESFAGRGVPLALQGVDGLIAACAMDDTAAARHLVRAGHGGPERGPELVRPDRPRS